MPFTDADLQVFTTSLSIGAAVVILGLPIAFGLALLLERCAFFGKGLVAALVHLPLVVPPVVVGYVLLLVFAPTGSLGKQLDAWGLGLAFHWRGAVLASFIMALPLMVRAIRQTLSQQDPDLLRVAASLQASPWRQFTAITLPLSLPGLLSASVLGFARAAGEFGATITFVSNIPGLTQTLPLALYSAAQTPGGESEALRLLILNLIPAIAALIASEWLASRHALKLGLKGQYSIKRGRRG